MATLTNGIIKIGGEGNSAEQVISFRRFVDSSGNFSIEIPEPTLLKVALEKIINESYAGYFAHMKRGKDYITGKELSKCEEILKKAYKVVNESEITESLVILAACSSNYSVWENNKWTHYGNLNSRKGYHGSCGETGPTYKVGIGANIYHKKTIKNRLGVRYEYNGNSITVDGRWVYIRDLVGTYGKMLSECGNYMLERSTSPQEGVMEIPYTEDAAKFFYDSIQAIIMLAKGISGMMGTPQEVEALAASYGANNTGILGLPFSTKEAEE